MAAMSTNGVNGGKRPAESPLPPQQQVPPGAASALETEAKRQRVIWDDGIEGTNGCMGLAAQILHQQGPQAYVSELKSNLLLQLTTRNSQLVQANFGLLNQLNELCFEHLALQFEYDRLVKSTASKVNLLETSGVLRLAQDEFARSFPQPPGAAGASSLGVVHVANPPSVAAIVPPGSGGNQRESESVARTK